MGLFNTILEKLGLKKEKDKASAEAGGSAKPAAASAPTKPTAPAKNVAAPVGRGVNRDELPKSEEAAAPKPISEVDVVAQLEKLAAANPAKLNWKVSIVDLLKLLDIESSYEARKELALELGCPAELMGDSAKMNVWLHKTVLKKIAENGGNIPKDLLD
ncbi:MAG: DUF3597 domain-containing protein [Chloroflexi bacterium]|nr:DUF3597 domain-containing protein [Chloroflexota bacterium]MDL1942642.1 DUF3597 domain-containing protein [Chloroflexi bacterium CFX2]